MHATLTVLSATCLAYAVYMIYAYILNPSGQWNILPNICCELRQKVPLYAHIIGAVLMFVVGPIRLFIQTNLCKYGICKQQKYNSLLEQKYSARTKAMMMLRKTLEGIYIVGALAASIGGLTFIALNGTVGGIMMSAPFTMYGVLLLILTFTMIVFIVKGKDHKYIAIRIFITGWSSLLYRIMYWTSPVTNFDTSMDFVYNWIFFLIPMGICELCLAIHKSNKAHDRGFQL